MKTFQCENCGGVFEKGWSDEEAHAEAAMDKFQQWLASHTER